jgi:hypothetical protein
MYTSLVWPRILVGVGLACMLIGAIDPLEGSFVVLIGVALATLGSVIGGSRYFQLLSWSFALVAIGVAVTVFFSWLGGLGGSSGHSIWWAVFILPYPAGWILGLFGAVLSLLDSWKDHSHRRMRSGA